MNELKIETFIGNDDSILLRSFPLLIYQEPHQPKTRQHSHNFVELALVLAGQGEHISEEQKRMVTAGDLFIVPMGRNHGYGECSEDFALVNILFNPAKLPIPQLDVNILPGFRKILMEEKQENSLIQIHLEDRKFQMIRDRIQEMYQELTEMQPGFMFQTIGLFMTLIGTLARIISEGSKPEKTPYLGISRVIAHLNRNFREPFDEKKLCRIGNMSQSTLLRHFRRTTGLSPLQYQNRLRLAEARHLIVTTRKSLREITYDVGFTDWNYFGRLFKQKMGCSPGHFRKIQIRWNTASLKS